MLQKKVVILTELDNSYAVAGQHVCGMVRISRKSNGICEVTTFLTNIDNRRYGKWYLVVFSGGNIDSYMLDTFNNARCRMEIADIDNMACLVVMVDNGCHYVCQSVTGNGRMDGITPEKLLKMINSIDTTTEYENFVAATNNYYGDLDLQAIEKTSKARYKAVEDYSTAFERYYARGGGDNYYDTVKKEVTRLLMQFPPHYALTNQYKDSFFVRIDFVGSDKYFVMGLLQEQGEVRYLCYGLPSSQNNNTDKDFCYVQCSDGGYYMLFQDAITGNITTIQEQAVV